MEGDHILCRFLSTDKLVHWLSFGYLLVPNELLNSEEAMAALMTVLSDGYVLTVYRTEVFHIHAAFEQLLGSIKEQKKTRNAVIDQVNKAISNSLSLHADRRTYLRQSLNGLLSIFADKPGLLGPKVRRP